MNDRKSPFWTRLVRYFLAGVFAVLPLVITILAVSWAIGLVNRVVGPETFLGEQLSRFGLRVVNDPKAAYVVGWLLVLTGIFVLGFFVESGMRKALNALTESVLRRVPLVGKVYDASKQLVGMIDSGGDDKLEGMSVVYCQFGDRGGVGLLALLPTPQTIPINDRPHHVVLVPQSPVPIGGGLLFVPQENVQRVPMSIDTFMSVYVSMGATVPKMMAQLPSDKGDKGDKGQT